MTTTATAAFLEAIALAAASQGNWVALHTNSPGTTGANELSGGTPAYARKQTTWAGATADGVVAGSEVEFDVPASTITHYSVWTAATGGTFLWSKSFPGSGVNFPGQMTLKLTPRPRINPTVA
ncbi:phage tail fiber protein [Rhodococcus aetherivorans]|uniref:phage tail fiber protein n=1 Tax=Rhodococcus aetherivorans TaxID=191292 RepID=UPI003CD04BD8